MGSLYLVGLLCLLASAWCWGLWLNRPLYEVRCTLGTRVRCATLDEARDWLSFCGPAAVVWHGGRVVAWRVVG